MMGAIHELWDWLQKPFIGQADPIHIIGVTGIVMVAAMGWGFVIYHMRRAAEVIE